MVMDGGDEEILRDLESGPTTSSSTPVSSSFAAFARRRQQQQQQQQQQQRLHIDEEENENSNLDQHPRHYNDQHRTGEPNSTLFPQWTTLGTKNRRMIRYVTSSSSSATSSPRNNFNNSSNRETDGNTSDHIQRGLAVTPLNYENSVPMSPGARFMQNIRPEEGGNDKGVGGRQMMYRLMATRGKRDIGLFGRSIRFFCACLNCGSLTESSIEQSTHIGYMTDPSRWVSDFFFWLFRSGWTSVILLSVIWYYGLVLLFSGLIIWSTSLDSDCVRLGDEELGEDSQRLLFMDAFSLSWNTFSTVGYGSSYPALSTQHNDVGDQKCVFIIFITSMEALAGVVYAGFTGAIFFAKVTRITQEADVEFSESLTVRFGLGVEENLVDDDVEASPREEDGLKQMSPMQKFKFLASSVGKRSPFPIITFRLVNVLHNVSGGEIILANLNAAVLTESRRNEHQISEDLAKQISTDRMRRFMSSSFHMRSLQSMNNRMTVGRDDGSVSKIVPRQIFTKLELDTHEHPLFKRMWRVNHVINANSPLLTEEAKNIIISNNGDWPWEWNNYNAVRRAIRFNELVVSFTGISNLTGASVYKQKVYDFGDTAVGYEFVHTLYRGRDGILKVDLNLLNDVIEQKGGGGEPLNVTAR